MRRRPTEPGRTAPLELKLGKRAETGKGQFAEPVPERAEHVNCQGGGGMNRTEFALQLTADAAAHIGLEVLEANSRDEIVAGGVDVACTIEPNRRIDSAERFA